MSESEDDLLRKVSRAIFDAENEWRRTQGEFGGDQLPERHYKVAIVYWMLLARSAIEAIENSKSHAVAPAEPTDEMCCELRRAITVVRDNLTQSRWVANEGRAYKAMLAARPKVLP